MKIGIRQNDGIWNIGKIPLPTPPVEVLDCESARPASNTSVWNKVTEIGMRIVFLCYMERNKFCIDKMRLAMSSGGVLDCESARLI